MQSRLLTKIFLLLILIIGTSSFFVVNVFSSSLKFLIEENKKSILSADLAFQSRFKIDQNKIESLKKQLGPQVESSESIEIFTMLSFQSKSKLIQLKSVAPSYPFYGEVVLTHRNSLKDLKEDEVVLAKELGPMLELKLGDPVQLGSRILKVRDFIDKDSSQGSGFGNFAYRVYVNEKALESTGLVQFGSTLQHWLYLKFSEDSKSLVERVEPLLKEYDLKLVTAERHSQQSARVVKYTLDYLNLISLVAVLLSVLALVYLYRTYVFRQKYAMALLNVLGLRFHRIIKNMYIELLALSFLNFVICAGLASVSLPFLSELLKPYTPVGFQLIWESSDFILLLVVCLTLPLLIASPLILDIQNTSTKELLNESVQFKETSLHIYLKWLPVQLLFFLSLVYWKTQSWLITVNFSLGLVVLIFLIVLVLSRLLRWTLVLAKNNWLLEQSLLYLTRKKSQSYTIVVCLTVGLSLFLLIPQLELNLKEQVASPRGLQLPSLFLFDIQEEQMTKLQELAQAEKWQLKNITPMVRARLIQVNGAPFERKYDVAPDSETDDSQFRNRGFNITYREGLNKSENLIEGEFNKSTSSEVGSISLEKRFAERMGLKMQDILEFDIQGVSIKGQVTSLREVKWNSFEPNFFIVMSPQDLEFAPKNFIATIFELRPEEISLVQEKVLKALPNVSTIDVKQLVSRILEISDSLLLAIEWMALGAIAVGIVVLLILSYQQITLRQNDFYMYKILGAKDTPLRWLVVSENMILFLFCGGFSLVSSYIAIKWVGKAVWLTEFVLYGGPLITTLLSVGLFIFIVALIFSYLISNHQNSLQKIQKI